MLWQGHAHGKGWEFVEVNSTLIVFNLCSTVQSMSIGTVTCFWFALYFSILGLNDT